MKDGWLGFWSRRLSFGLALLALAGPAAGQARAQQKSIGFSNLVFRPSGGDRVGIADENFELYILEELRRRGLNAVGGEDLVFGVGHGKRAELLLGGTVTQLDCVDGSARQSVTCRMAVEWQVLDVASEAVVYKVTTWGRVIDARKDPPLGVGKGLVFANLGSLTTRAAFHALLKPDAPRAAATAQGYPRANVRGCRAAQQVMPAASESVLEAAVLVQTSSGFGSGFLLSPDGFVATAAHVVTESTATVKLRDGREYSASVIRVDRRLDVALLRLAVHEGTNLPCLPVKLGPVAVGSDVYAVGSPASRDLSFSLARGIVSGVRLLEGLAYLQTDAAVNRGNSGGPLVTATGEAAAIVSFKLSGASVEGIAFGVPLAPALDAVGITVGQGFTSPELSSAAAAPAPPPPRSFEDRRDAEPELSPSKPRSTSVQGVGPRRTSPQVKHGLYVWGATALVTGLSFVLLAEGFDSQAGHQDTASRFRTWGWVTTATGGVLLGIGVALP